MIRRTTLVAGAAPAKTDRFRFAFWVSALTAVTALVSLATAITTPPRSGPFCLSGPCITYPYTDAAAYVPADYMWMYPTLLMVSLFAVLVVCIHQSAPDDKKIFSQIALIFALVSTTALTTDYFIQIAVMQPSFVLGEVEGLSLFSQYNPHGVFIALEDLGYLLMSLAFLFCAPVFVGSTVLERSIKWLFIATAVLTVGTLALLVILFGMNLEYRFEVFSLLINWLTLIISGILLSLFFRRFNI